MKSATLSSVLLFLVALPFAVAGDYDTTSVSTVYSTKTVYAVHTEIKTGTPPASTSSSSSTPTYYPSSYGTSIVSSSPVYPTGTATGYYPTGTGAGTPVISALPTFTGAASQLNVNALVAAIAAGMGYLAL